MSRVRRNERRTGTNAAIDAATNPGSWRSDKTTRNRTHSRHDNANAESCRASGNAANKSDNAAGSYCAAGTKTVTDTSRRQRAWWIERAQRNE